MMLFRKDFGWSHQRDVKAAFQSHQRGAGGDDGFAGTDVPLKQTAHWLQTAHIGADLPKDFGLRIRERVGKRGKKWSNETIISGSGNRFGAFEKFSSARANGNLQLEKLIESE